MDIFLVIAGLGILVVAGDVLVKGAVALSFRMGVPPLIVSLTIVALGTSLPELLVSVDAALRGAPGLALGNVIGSNTANILLVLGLPALLSGLGASGPETARSYWQMLGVSAVFIALVHLGPLHYWHGALLICLLAAMLWTALGDARTARAGRVAPAAAAPDVAPQTTAGEESDAPEATSSMIEEAEELGEEAAALPVWRALLYLVVSIAALPLGADLLVGAATRIAASAGVSDEVIGLTLVAIGTSLPELATTVMAAIRGRTEVALGNVIGSNLLNILAIMGVTSFFGPLVVDPHLLRLDVWVMAGAALALMPVAVLGRRLGRRAGVVFLAAYTTYMFALF